MADLFESNIQGEEKIDKQLDNKKGADNDYWKNKIFSMENSGITAIMKAFVIGYASIYTKEQKQKINTLIKAGEIENSKITGGERASNKVNEAINFIESNISKKQSARLRAIYNVLISQRPSLEKLDYNLSNKYFKKYLSFIEKYSSPASVVDTQFGLLKNQAKNKNELENIVNKLGDVVGEKTINLKIIEANKISFKTFSGTKTAKFRTGIVDMTIINTPEGKKLRILDADGDVMTVSINQSGMDFISAKRLDEKQDRTSYVIENKNIKDKNNKKKVDYDYLDYNDYKKEYPAEDSKPKTDKKDGKKSEPPLASNKESKKDNDISTTGKKFVAGEEDKVAQKAEKNKTQKRFTNGEIDNNSSDKGNKNDTMVNRKEIIKNKIKSNFENFRNNKNNISSIASFIESSETNNNKSNLFFKGKNENFLSMGVGHFIWTNDNKYDETFPKFIDFFKTQNSGINVPKLLLEKDPPLDKSGNVKKIKDFTEDQKTEITKFLFKTKDIQVLFILKRTEKSLFKIINTEKDEKINKKLIENINKILQYADKNPEIIAMMIDYVNFKGDGTNENERTNSGKGWGLKQVILGMNFDNDVKNEFIKSAKNVLQNRINEDKNIKKRENGWMKRVDNYKNIKFNENKKLEKTNQTINPKYITINNLDQDNIKAMLKEETKKEFTIYKMNSYNEPSMKYNDKYDENLFKKTHITIHLSDQTNAQSVINHGTNTGNYAYVIDQNGKVIEVNNPNKGQDGSGPLGVFNGDPLSPHRGIGIEFVGKGDQEKLTPAQQESGKKLIAYLKGIYNMPDKNYLTTSAQTVSNNDRLLIESGSRYDIHTDTFLLNQNTLEALGFDYNEFNSHKRFPEFRTEDEEFTFFKNLKIRLKIRKDNKNTVGFNNKNILSDKSNKDSKNYWTNFIENYKFKHFYKKGIDANKQKKFEENYKEILKILDIPNLIITYKDGIKIVNGDMKKYEKK